MMSFLTFLRAFVCVYALMDMNNTHITLKTNKIVHRISFVLDEYNTTEFAIFTGSFDIPNMTATEESR